MRLVAQPFSPHRWVSRVALFCPRPTRLGKRLGDSHITVRDAYMCPLTPRAISSEARFSLPSVASLMLRNFQLGPRGRWFTLARDVRRSLQLSDAHTSDRLFRPSLGIYRPDAYSAGSPSVYVTMDAHFRARDCCPLFFARGRTYLARLCLIRRDCKRARFPPVEL